jgi:PAS domain S-box-containing protein
MDSSGPVTRQDKTNQLPTSQRKGISLRIYIYLIIGIATLCAISLMVLVGNMFVGIGILLVLVVLFAILLEQLVFKRLARLTCEVAAIATKASLASRINSFGSDEVGRLAQNINTSLAALETVTKEKEFQQIQNESVLEVLEEGLVITDIRKRIIYVNPALVRLLGFTLSELEGKEFFNAFLAFDFNDEPLPPKFLDDPISSITIGSIIRVYLAGKGQKIPVVINTAPVVVNGKLLGVMRTIIDYTPELQIQKQKDDFFSFASHELRTPLTIIKGNTLMVLEGPNANTLNDNDKECLKDVRDSTDRLIRLVSEFLNVSRIDQGRVQMDIQDVDVCELIQKVVKEMTSLYANKGLTLEFVCEPPRVTAKADPDKLKEVFINLLGNSVKFTQKGGVTITHTVADNTLTIHVKDTGMGISEDQASHLFDRFKRVTDDKGVRLIEGTGLGLFICRQFTTLMDGDVWIEKTRPGEGTTFGVRLPISRQ